MTKQFYLCFIPILKIGKTILKNNLFVSLDKERWHEVKYEKDMEKTIDIKDYDKVEKLFKPTKKGFLKMSINIMGLKQWNNWKTPNIKT